MNVITKYPIYINGKSASNNDNQWSSLPGDPTPSPYDVPNAPTAEVIAEAAKKGINWDKVKGWVKQGQQIGQQTGLWDFLKNKLGTGKKPNANVPITTAPPMPIEKKGMSTTTMLMIGGGVVAIGLIAYLVTRKK